MDPREYRQHFALEETHWWFRGRRSLAQRLLASCLGRPAGIRILDAGCGTGANLLALAGSGEAFGCDISEDALRFCRQRGIKKIARADAARLPYKSGSFDLVTLFDVLYHKAVASDVAVLEEVRRVLRPGGSCLITDSALPILHGPHDEALGARERYTRRTLKKRVERAGLQVVRATYFYLFPFPAIFLVRQVQKLRRRARSAPLSDLAPVATWLNSVLARVMTWEAAMAVRMSLPVGSSVVFLAQKKLV
jgi:SAM-dependent methyltransferase